MEHTKNVMLRKCNCGNKGCDQFFISSSRANGRFLRPDALLYAAAPEMLEILVTEVIYMKKYGQSKVYSFDKVIAVIEKATGKTIGEVIKNGVTK